MTVRPWWRDGQLIDLPGALVRVGEEAGLVLYERNVALLAGLRGDQLVPRTSFFALEAVRKARQRGVPRLAVAHEDFLVFKAPLTSMGASAPRLLRRSRTRPGTRPGRSRHEARRAVLRLHRPFPPSGMPRAEALTSPPEVWPPPVDRRPRFWRKAQQPCGNNPRSAPTCAPSLTRRHLGRRRAAVTERLLSQEEAARLAGCSKDTIVRARRSGRFPNARLRDRRWAIPTDDLVAAGLYHPVGQDALRRPSPTSRTKRPSRAPSNWPAPWRG